MIASSASDLTCNYGLRGIAVGKEFRKITISNPGTSCISIDEAVDGGISDARNGQS